MNRTLRNMMNILVAIAIVFAPVSSVLAGKVHQCDESAMPAMTMDMQPAADSMTNLKSCKCKHAANQACCCNNLCTCLSALHGFIGLNVSHITLDKFHPVYNKLVSVMETDLFVFPLLRPPIA